MRIKEREKSRMERGERDLATELTRRKEEENQTKRHAAFTKQEQREAMHHGSLSLSPPQTPCRGGLMF